MINTDVKYKFSTSEFESVYNVKQKKKKKKKKHRNDTYRKGTCQIFKKKKLLKTLI